jgi:hypothetical protein
LSVEHLKDLAPLAALGAWRYTQGIYQFHPDILTAIMDTAPHGELPVDVLLRMPEWSIYIETPGFSCQNNPVHGFFAFLEYDVNHERPELRFVLVREVESGELSLLPAWPVHLGPWTITKAMNRMRKEAMPHQGEVSDEQKAMFAEEMTAAALERDTAIVYGLVSLVLYLCSDEPDIAGYAPGAYPQRPSPKKVKGGWRFFPPDKPRIWRVGEEIGAKLAQAVAREATQVPIGERKRSIPHVRRAHWHGYRVGPKPRPDIPEERQVKQRYVVHWLPPMLVAAREEEA